MAEKTKMLLTEYNELSVTKDQLNESAKNNSGKIIVPCLLQRADTVNANGRIYPMAVLQREVKNYSRLVEDSRAVGTLDHEEISEVSLKEASHIIRKIWWENNNEVHGMLEVLNTPNGNILRSLMESGVKIGVSSRAVGSLKESKDGYSIVEDDLVIVAFDAVQDPSTSKAYLDFKLREARDFNINKVYNRVDRIHRILNNFMG